MEEDDLITLIVILALIVVALVLVLFVFCTMTGAITIPNKLNIGEWLNGRAAVSKTVDCAFKSYLPCHLQ